jgi:hypothetical protein
MKNKGFKKNKLPTFGEEETENDPNYKELNGVYF